MKGIEDISLKTSDNKEQYKNLLNEAEGLYAQMAYEKCVEKYQQALRFYEDHYVPDRKFVEQRITSAKSRVGYVEFLENGKEAVTSGNYALALEYFKKARNIDDTPKIREWIKHCELKLGLTSNIPPPITNKSPEVVRGTTKVEVQRPQTTIVPRKNQGVSSLVWVIGIFVLFGIIGLIYLGVRSWNNSSYTYDKLSDPAYQSDVVRLQNSYQPDEKNNNPSSTSPLAADLLPGTWDVSDRVIDRNILRQNGNPDPGFLGILSGRLPYVCRK